MKLGEITKILNDISPFSLQDSWDNSGVVVGNIDDNIDEIVLTLDVTSEVVKQAKPHSLILAHHPLIFSGIKQMDGNYPNNLLKQMNKKDISHIAMHTNIDKTDLSKYVVEKILGYKLLLDREYEHEYIKYFEVNLSFDELLTKIRDRMKISHLNFVKTDNNVKICALVTGSGMGLIKEAKCDCYLTGDIKHHEAIEAYENGVSLIDITHYESEKYFTDLMVEKLKSIEKEIAITVKLNSNILKKI